MAPTTWNFDPAHSEITFKVRHMMFSKVTGFFHDWKGDFKFDPEDPSKAEIHVDIETASVDTNNEDRDQHLRSGDFFDVEEYPHITFTSTEMAKAEGGHLELNGDLTIKGQTNPVTLAVDYHGKAVDPWGNDRLGFSATTSLHRKDFGLTWNQALEAGGVLVGDKVEVELNVQAIAG